jgi:hypothetical protein
MSEFINGNGRAEGTGAPAKALEKTVETDRIETTETASSAVPSSHNPKALHEHLAAGHELIPLRHWKAKDSNGKPMGKAGLPNWRRSAALSFAEAEAHMARGSNIGVRLQHGERSDGGVFHADHAILARARLPVRQSGSMAADRSNAPLRGLRRGEGKGSNGKSAPKGMAAGVTALGGQSHRPSNC